MPAELPSQARDSLGSRVGKTPTGRCRLRLFSDARRSQAETSAVDFVRDDALMERFSNSLIQALQKRGDAFIVAAHEGGDQLLVVDGDGRALYWSHPPEHDVAPGTGEQRCDMWPAIFRIGR
jgi:hypothetical protein